MTETLPDTERAAIIEELARSRFGAGLSGAGRSARRRSPVCGDEVTVEVTVTDAAIQALRWDGHGCVVSTAASALLAELAVGVAAADFPALAARYLESVEVDGQPVPELGDAEVFAGIGRFPLRAGCASLAWRAALDALAAA